MKSKTSSIFTLLSAAACVVGCGSLPEDESQPSTLVTLEGSISDSNGAISQSGVRVALIWSGADDTHALAVETTPEASFPASFKLDVTSPPPPSQLGNFDDLPGTKGSYGVLAAYKDQNGNGKLDMLGLKEPAIDQIVGKDANHALLFFSELSAAAQQELKDESGNVPSLGFNMLAVDSFESGKLSWAPLSTAFTLTSDDSKEAQELMCADGFSASGGGGPLVTAPAGTIGPDGNYPDPSDPNLECGPGADEYRYTTQTVVFEYPCSSEYSTTTTLYKKDPGTTPAGWPCP